MSDDDREKYPSEEAERFQVRMPPGLRDRIKFAADENNRSMNAEIVGTLLEKYPPKTVDLQNLADFLGSIAGAENSPEFRAYLADINDILSYHNTPFTAKISGDGVVTFYPYATPREADDNS